MSADRFANLGTRLIGRTVCWHESLPSTNDLAVQLTGLPAPEGTVVLADEQTAGRGRLGRPWASPRGGIWLSVILRPAFPLERVSLVGLAAAVATARAIREITELPARVKWPNDVLVGGSKIVGILTEATAGAEWVVVGVGINANIPLAALPLVGGYPATSLQALLGHPVDREGLIRAVLRELDQGYAELGTGGTGGMLRRWREISDTLGRSVRVEMPDGAIEGTALDVDDAGALLVRLDDGEIRRVVAGDLRVREPGR
ncbi:MAG TPA: biotin--[acetyl-CoA-carboxylase] ligase [bacterium]|nr:biotin--[acetyl-CoA-carboxylase] ligase [bacterium]